MLSEDSDEELFRRTGNYLTTSTVLRAGTIDCLRCADFKHDVAHSVCSILVIYLDNSEIFMLETSEISRVSFNCSNTSYSWTQSIFEFISSDHND